MYKELLMKYGIIFIVLTALLLGCSNQNNNKISDNSKQIYTCPMHPQVISDKPGVCPICHMDLVLKKSLTDTGQVKMDEIIDFSGNEEVLANISVIQIKRINVINEIHSFSTLDFAENTKKTISARFNGRIEKLYADKTGNYIKKGDPLFEIYSPELIQAQNDFIIGLNNENLASVSKEKLKLFGITDLQIEELSRTKMIKNSIVFYSPYSGTVLEKKVQEGMYVNEGTILYDIADLSILWNLADVYEADLNYIKTGSSISLHLNSYPDEKFEGKVTLVYPLIDQKTHTVKVRSTINNRNNKLKPYMYGETIFKGLIVKALMVPSEAILMTGDRNLVYVELSKGRFSRREVKLGNKINNDYIILSGLTEGEKIAYSGGYLIDSETRLRGFTK